MEVILALAVLFAICNPGDPTTFCLSGAIPHPDDLGQQMLAFITTAQAQGYLTQPGRAPTYAIPRGDGTYVIPGQRPTFITPRGNRTYVIQSPGHRPAYAIPRGDGTYVIQGH
jgi:hypothetical protein